MFALVFGLVNTLRANIRQRLLRPIFLLYSALVTLNMTFHMSLLAPVLKILCFYASNSWYIGVQLITGIGLARVQFLDSLGGPSGISSGLNTRANF